MLHKHYVNIHIPNYVLIIHHNILSLYYIVHTCNNFIFLFFSGEV